MSDGRTAAASARHSRLAPYLLIAPGILWLTVFFVVPLIALAQSSVAASGEPWWDAYVRALGTYGTHFLRSFRYALIATCWPWRWATRWRTSSRSGPAGSRICCSAW